MILWLFLHINMPVESASKPMHEIPHCHSWETPTFCHDAHTLRCLTPAGQQGGSGRTGSKARLLPGLPKLYPTPGAPIQTPQTCTPWVTSWLGWPGAGPQSPGCEDWWFVSSLSAGKTPARPAVAPWVPGAAPRSLCPFPTASPHLSTDWSPYSAANCSTSAMQSQLADGLPKAWIHRLLTVQTVWQKKKKHKTKIGNNIQMWHFRRSISGYCPPTQILSWNWSR